MYLLHEYIPCWLHEEKLECSPLCILSSEKTDSNKIDQKGIIFRSSEEIIQKTWDFSDSEPRIIVEEIQDIGEVLQAGYKMSEYNPISWCSQNEHEYEQNKIILSFAWKIKS